MKLSRISLRLWTLLAAFLLPIAVAEFSVQVLTRLDLIDVPKAMTTMVPKGSEDWRLAHITADQHREPDPVLLWQPRNEPPYNRQRLKGPLASIPKPPDVFRIVAYGDSNTDGPDTGDWPTQLGKLLRDREAADRPDRGRKIEVLNAGVAGYSSYQGRLRFEQQAAQLEPDLVLVSFGWNDAADALGHPDRSFEPPPRPAVALQRLLLRLQSYRLLRSWTATSVAAQSGRRVPPEDYLENLTAFVDVAAKRGTRVVLLTRPTRENPAQLAKHAPNWRAFVPEYSDVLRSFARHRDTPLIDVNAHFLRNESPSHHFADECHFSALGREQMAEFIANELAGAGLLDHE